jgi:hypothetical protein
VSTQAETWLEAQMANPEFRAEYVRELARMHREALDQKNPTLARWCMRERARVDSTDSTVYDGGMR